MLTKNQKKELVKDLAEKIKTAKSIVFADFKGIKVKDLTLLKKELRKEKVDFRVVKKTFINIAFKETGIEMDAKKMDGQVAISIAKEDEIAPAKILSKFAKNNENLKIISGILESKILSKEEIKALASLPSKDELLAKLVGTINAPVSGFVNVLAGNMRGLVQALKAISESK